MFDSNNNNTFKNIDDLKSWVIEDKEATGVGDFTRNRYPIRFVLFDNFRDCYNFVDFLQSERNALVESVDKWVDPAYPDLIITHVELAEKIKSFIDEVSPNDCVIAPFSELARFYDNKKKKAFDALVKTIKGIQTTPEAFELHQRIYIPIVGLEGKMETFVDDSQTTIWRLISDEKDLTYRLILTNGDDFGVNGLSSKYTIVNNIREWLNIWKDTKLQVTPNIICKSSSIYANAGYAQPDNAFSYVTCKTAAEFLIEGLQLGFGGIQYLSSDGDNWNKLARQIDISGGFNFDKFVKTYFGADDISDHKDFIKYWFNHPGVFERWLLARYYMSRQNEKGYLCRVLMATSYYGDSEFIERMTTDISEIPSEMDVRKYCLQYAAKKHVRLSEAAEASLSKILENLPTKLGFSGAMEYFTGISRKEKELALLWFGQNKIKANDLKLFFSDLYYYVTEGIGIPTSQEWVEDYMLEYKRAKIANRYTEVISQKIDNLNASESTFDSWYNKFKTTYTELKDRNDIEIFYWIDGLGVDWIPLIKKIIAEKKEHKIFLNEVKIARALLPTVTDINKTDLKRLLPEGANLQKMGDLDTLAHKTNNISPFTLLKEIEIIRNSIEDILNAYIGKKIAIISDHGLNYLSQLLQGKNMGGVESDHHGRIAIRNKPETTADSSYFRLEDNKTLCALKHESLCSKVPSNQGIHGGCAPEEVLVPIFIISSQEISTNWSADILNMSISGADPYVRFSIKNLPSTDIPYLEYNNNRYELHPQGGDIYESDAIAIENGVETVALHIGETSTIYNLTISTGVEMDDLF